MAARARGDELRDLRSRAGSSAWRAFYQSIDDEFVVAAIGPEAQSDPKGFARAVELALVRLESDGDNP